MSEKPLTLITCSGESNASISEYNERTVVRAIQVEVIEATTPGTEDQQAVPTPVALVTGGKVWLTAI